MAAGCSLCGTESDGGQLSFSLGLSVDPFTEFESGSPVLEGSLVCLDRVEVVEGISASTSEWWNECVEVSAEGPHSLDDEGCYRFDAGLGEVTISMQERPCSVEDAPFSAGDFADDTLRFEVVEAGSVEARLDPGSIERYLEAVAHPGPAGEWPADWIPSAESPLRAIAGEVVVLPVTLWQGSGAGSIVAWSVRDGALTITRGAASEPYTASWAPAEIEETLMVDEAVTVELERQDHRWEAGALQGVDISAVASIKLVAAYGRLSDEELAELPADAPRWGEPLGVRAVVRDAEDRLLRAVPVEWEVVEGAMLLSDLEARRRDAVAETEEHDLVDTLHRVHLIPGEYLQVDATSCLAPEPAPVARNATIMASVDGHQASLDLEWSELAREKGEEPFVVPELCTVEGCGCRSSGDAPGGFLFSLLVLGLWRRRRAPQRAGVGSGL